MTNTLVLADIKNEVLNRAIQAEGNGSTLTDEDIFKHCKRSSFKRYSGA